MPTSHQTELIVVRHGETVWNAQGRQQGQLDSDLSPLGRRQAQAIADRLAAEKFEDLYSSDLGRAYRTAECIARKTGHQITTDRRLRERNMGIFEGLTISEIHQQYPDEYRRFLSGDPDYVIPGGESARQRHDRTTRCVDEIAPRYLGRSLVIVAHGGVLSGFFRHAVGIPLSVPRRYKLFNASINTFFIEDGTWTLATWGDIQHLTQIGTTDDW